MNKKTTASNVAVSHVSRALDSIATCAEATYPLSIPGSENLLLSATANKEGSDPYRRDLSDDTVQRWFQTIAGLGQICGNTRGTSQTLASCSYTGKQDPDSIGSSH